MRSDGPGLLLLQIRRHQEELRRWRQLELHMPAPKPPQRSTTRNAAGAAAWQESQELQALVMERRELLARQKSQSREHNVRVLLAGQRALRPTAEPEPSSDEDVETGGQVAGASLLGERRSPTQSPGEASIRSYASRGDGSRQAIKLQEKMHQLQAAPMPRPTLARLPQIRAPRVPGGAGFDARAPYKGSGRGL